MSEIYRAGFLAGGIVVGLALGIIGFAVGAFVGGLCEASRPARYDQDGPDLGGER